MLINRENVVAKSSVNKESVEAMFKQWQNDAMIIYDSYISLQATASLGSGFNWATPLNILYTWHPFDQPSFFLFILF